MIYLLIAVFFSWNYMANYYQPKWSILSFFVAAYLIYLINIQSSVYFSSLFGWIIFSSLIYSIYDYNRKRGNSYARLEMASTSIGTISLAIAFIVLDEQMIHNIISVFPILLFLNAIIKFIPNRYKTIKSDDGHGKPYFGLGGNEGPDSCLSALMFSLVLTSDSCKYVIISSFVFTLICIVKNKTSAGALGFAFSILTFLVFKGHLLVASLLVILCALLFKNKWMISDSGRFKIWRFAITHLIKKETLLLGIGNGLFKLKMGNKQMEVARDLFVAQNPQYAGRKDIIPRTSISIWCHNDAIQYLIECGVIGCILMAVFLISIVPMIGIKEAVFFSALVPCVFFSFSMHMADQLFITLMVIKGVYLK